MDQTYSKLSKLTLVMVMFVPVAASAAALQRAHIMTLTFKKPVKAVCSTATDNISARLELTGLNRQAIQALGTSIKAGPYHVSLRHELGDVVVAFVEYKEGLVRCRVLTTGKKLRVLMGTVDRREYFKDIIASVLEPLPVTYDTTASKRLKKVLKLMHKRAYGKAIKVLTKLRRRAHLRDYIALRRADIHMLAGRIPTAYVKYKNVQELMTTRSMRLLARARAAEVAYVVDHSRPTKLLIKSLQRPAPILGQLARARLINVLIRLGKLEEALALSRVQPMASTRMLNSQLLQVLLRRYLRQGKPYKAALVYLRTRKMLPKAAARAEVLLLAGRAYMELDLPGDATKVLQQSLAADKQPRLRERVVSLLARAYLGSKQYYRARQTADYYTASFPKGPRLYQVVELRAGLKLREGDLKGAREDLARLRPDQAKGLRKLLDIKSGKSDTGSVFKSLSSSRKRQEDIRRRMEAKR